MQKCYFSWQAKLTQRSTPRVTYLVAGATGARGLLHALYRVAVERLVGLPDDAGLGERARRAAVVVRIGQL